jgi:mono/diheme cytochrome c family protein
MKMKRTWLCVGLAAMFCGSAFVVRAQDADSGEKLFKGKCAGCHGTDAAGKPAVKSPSIKGKTADQIQQVISTSPKHASLKKLTADEVKSIAAYLGTLK